MCGAAFFEYSGLEMNGYKSIPRSQFLCHPVNPSSTLNFENGKWLETDG